MERNAAESFRIAALLDTPDDNDLISPRDIRANKDICMLCYLPCLFWFPLLSRPASRFARLHANQGMLLTLVSSCWWILEYTLTSYFNDELLYFLSILLGALNVFVLILIGFGIINCSNGLAKEMPLFGHFRIIETIKPLKEE